MEPYEMIISPFEVWLAQVGEPFPHVDDVPAGNWALLGKNGKDNMSDAGVTVTHEQTIVQKRNVGSTGVKKVARTEEGLTISMVLEDLTLETYAKVLNGQSVGQVSAGAGVPGQVSIGLMQGAEVAEFAVLVRGASAYDSNLHAQYQIPRAYQSDNPAPVFNKADVASLKCTFTVMEDLDAASPLLKFGKLIMADAPATS
jgi:hypothetical protein